MKTTAYIRVSTQAQSYDRQLYDLNAYFQRMKINSSDVEFVEEKITSHTTFKQRAIYPVLKNSHPGDIIYVCQLDRLGRTVEDIIQLVKYADNLGVELYAIKEGQRITYKTQTGKMLLMLLAMVAEMERELRAERCQSGTDAAIAELKKHGCRIARSSGKKQTHWGNKKGTEETKRIMAIAAAAASEKRTDEAMEWREHSKAVKFARRKSAEGWTVTQIANELGMLYDDHNDAATKEQNPFGTAMGCRPSKGTVSKWLRESNPIAPELPN